MACRRGSAVTGFSGDGGPATSAQLFSPAGIAVDGAGNLFILDRANERIRKVDASTGIIDSIAGCGRTITGGGTDCPPYAGDGGPALDAPLATDAKGLAVSPNGQIYFANYSGVRVMTESGSSSVCRVRLSAATIEAPSTGGSFKVHVETGAPGCFWSVARQPGWITPFPKSGFGSGDIELVVSGNLDPPRRATIIIGGVPVEVIQDSSLPPLVGVRKFHSGDFWQGEPWARFEACVWNAGGPTGPLTVTEHLPNGLSLTSIGAYGAACSGDSCTWADGLPWGGWEWLRIDASVADNAPPQVTNTITVSANGSVLASATDTARVLQLEAPVLLSPANGAKGVPYSTELKWAETAMHAAAHLPYDVYFGETPEPPFWTKRTGGALPVRLKPNTTYYWRVVATTGSRSMSSPTWSFTTESDAPWTDEGAMVNAASFREEFAPGSWVAIFGQNLASTTREWRPDEIVNGKLPTQLDDVTVTINSFPAPISYISPTQVNVQVPDEAMRGKGLTTYYSITNKRGTWGWVAKPLLYSAPAFFMYEPAGRKYIAAQHADLSMLGPPGLYPGVKSTPAKPGEIVVLYGTGFGWTWPAAPAGQLVTTPVPLSNLSRLKVWMGGVEAEVQWAGLVMAGLWQINVKVPENLPDGDAPVVAEIEGQFSQSNAFIAIKR